ncbi:MAG: sugar phosphorylase [Akkermansiaceae bacterium]|nr:sugar phosphorylase [Akkermansiaceae bacterium]NNM28712.1 sugar phosphorylase [Akkermansiaceae bacterium]
MKLIRRSTFNRMKLRLGRLYGRDRAEQLSDRLYMLIGRYGVSPMNGDSTGKRPPLWSEKDTVLITYADMVTHPGERPLQTLKNFCDRRLRGAVSVVHVLPFFPSSSDGGFSVIDYRRVDRALGTWRDIELLAQEYGLMADLVVNHCSRRSSWFRDYVSGVAPQDSYFQEGDPGADLSAVVRPRPWPLLTPTETSRGERHVWTTFSADQVDLNWQCPDVLFEFLDLLLGYVARGARIIRLDAVAFLWKKPGTRCVHLPETHEVVKLMRDILKTVAPHVILLTETNVPHEENISYFGKGDEAHMVYQFTLPPLLLHGLLRGDSRELQKWARSLPELPKGCTYLNFTASHDGIGVRPLEGILAKDELEWLVGEVKERGGLVSYRSMPDGSERPYEMNITYRDALRDAADNELGMRRFLCSQAVMLALQGVPAPYFHSLVGERNWVEGPQRPDGENRDINRRRWDWRELERELDDPESDHGWLHNVYVRMLRARTACPAFHPDGPQEILETGGEVFALRRTSLNGRIAALCCFNFQPGEVTLTKELVQNQLGSADCYRNLLNGQEVEFTGGGHALAAYECCWVVAG